MSSLKFCIWQGTNNTHPCEPKVHMYNIRKAKGSYLLIVPLDVWVDYPQAYRVPRGKPEMSQTKTLNIYFILILVQCIFYYFVQFDQQMHN
jgi:hypothetical protein